MQRLHAAGMAIAIALFAFSVHVSATPAAALTAAGNLIGAYEAQLRYPTVNGVHHQTGQVQRIAILDTGIDWSHPALAGRVVAGINFASDAPSGSTNPNHYMDQHGHGTFIAGVVGSQWEHLPGIAPNVEFVAVRVMNSNGQGSYNSIVQGLDWINKNARRLNITAVNVSIGSTATYTGPGAVPNLNVFTNLQNQLAALEAKNIFTAVASGNGGSKTGLSIPAIFDSAVSVGASTKSDNIASYTNRNDLLDLLAPGSSIQSLWRGGGTSTGSGTSYAAPFAAASAMLLRDMLEQYSDDLLGEYMSLQARLVDLMQLTGTPIYDSASDQTYMRLDLLAAMGHIHAQYTTVPEPATLALLGLGAAGLLRRRRRAA